MGEAPDNIVLIETEQDVDELEVEDPSGRLHLADDAVGRRDARGHHPAARAVPGDRRTAHRRHLLRHHQPPGGRQAAGAQVRPRARDRLAQLVELEPPGRGRARARRRLAPDRQRDRGPRGVAGGQAGRRDHVGRERAGGARAAAGRVLPGARAPTDVEELEVVQEDVRFMLPKTIRQALAGGPPSAERRPAHARRLRPAPRGRAQARTCCAASRRSRALLLGGLSTCDRLVLLGDVIELRQGPVREALAAAEPVLRRDRCGAGPGERGRDRPRQPRPSPGRRVAGTAARATPSRRRSGSSRRSTGSRGRRSRRSRVARRRRGCARAYPGVWLRDDVYAIHGHYVDRHTTVPMFERLGAGVMARLVARRGRLGQRAPRTTRRSLAPIYAWIHARRPESDGRRQARQRTAHPSRAWRTLVGRRSPAPRARAGGARARVPGSRRRAQPRRLGTAAGRHLRARAAARRAARARRRRCDVSA